jgi:hypothetical protein
MILVAKEPAITRKIQAACNKFYEEEDKELDYILLSSIEWEELRVAYRLKEDTLKFRLRFSADHSVELRQGDF